MLAAACSPCLHGDLRHARQHGAVLFQVGQVADHKDVVVRERLERRPDGNPAAAHALEAADRPPARRRARRPSRPGWPSGMLSPDARTTASGSIRATALLTRTSTPMWARRPRTYSSPPMPRRRASAASSRITLASCLRSRSGIVPRQRLEEQLGDCAGELDARRPAADDHKGEQAPAFGRCFRRQLGSLFHALEDVVAQDRTFLDRLERKAVGLGARRVEEVVGAAQRQDQVIVVKFLVGPADQLPLQVDALHVEHGKAHVGLVAHDAAHRVGDQLRLHLGRRHLVEQGIEGMIVVLVDQPYRQIRAAERLGGPQPAKPGPDDHHLGVSYWHKPSSLRQSIAVNRPWDAGLHAQPNRQGAVG